jgi:hypothetical protein
LSRHASRKRIETFAYPSVCSWTVSRSTASNRRSRSLARPEPISRPPTASLRDTMVNSIKAARTAGDCSSMRSATPSNDLAGNAGLAFAQSGTDCASVSLLSHLVPVTRCGNALRWQRYLTLGSSSLPRRPRGQSSRTFKAVASILAASPLSKPCRYPATVTSNSPETQTPRLSRALEL